MRTLLLAAACALGGAAAPLLAQAPAPADAAPARAAVTPRVRALAGCYRLTVGPWQHAPTGGPTMASQQPPERFRLDTVAPPPPFKDRFAVEPAKMVAYAHMPARWSVEGDSVDLGWSTGFTGVQLRLAVRGDTLVGRAQTHHDAHYRGEPPDPEAAVRAVRTRCASKPSSS